jgi:hypothetical protein
MVKYVEIELHDAVRLSRSRAELYLSRNRPNELFRKLKTGRFSPTTLEIGDDGYVSVPVVGGGKEALHRLVVDTFDHGAFVSKLEENPDLTMDDLDVDHVDGEESNNAFENLKVLTKMEHIRKHAFAIDLVDDGWVLETFECASDVVDSVRGKDGRPLGAGNVQKVCDGVQTHTGGQVFEWADSALVASKRAAKLKKHS